MSMPIPHTAALTPVSGWWLIEERTPRTPEILFERTRVLAITANPNGPDRTDLMVVTAAGCTEMILVGEMPMLVHDDDFEACDCTESEVRWDSTLRAQQFCCTCCGVDTFRPSAVAP